MGYLRSERSAVVLTHHGPHPLSVHPRYLGVALNAAFVSNLTLLLPKAAPWIHAHVHDNFDYHAACATWLTNAQLRAKHQQLMVE